MLLDAALQSSVHVCDSYFHNFETTTWSAVYKYKPVDDFKVKLGYDSDVRLCWSSFWVNFLVHLALMVPTHPHRLEIDSYPLSM